MSEAAPGAAVACDLCGSTAGTVLFTAPGRQFGGGQSFRIVRCTQCGLVRTEPQPEDLGAFYPDDYYSFAAPRRPGARVLRRLRRVYGPPLRRPGPLTRRLLPGLPPGPPGDVLDVGCGSGQTLLALQAAGWRCRGIDPSAQAVAAARAAGLDVDHGDLVDRPYPPESLDAVRFWHSLEHTRSPAAQLREAHRVLRPGGTLTIGVPNFASLLARLARTRWYFLDVPRHLWHFERETLAALLRGTGFAVSELRTVTESTALLGTLGSVFSEPDALLRRRLLWLSALPVPVLLDVVRTGDALEATARKPPPT